MTLELWNNTQTKQAILDYVAAATDENGPDYVPPAERIAATRTLIAVTTTAAGEEQVGVARYTTNLDKRSCEFALVVSDRWRGRGIAHHLMLNLMDVARARGLETIEGIVLKSNSRMLALMESLNFEISNDREDPSVKRVVAQLHKPH